MSNVTLIISVLLKLWFSSVHGMRLCLAWMHHSALSILSMGNRHSGHECLPWLTATTICLANWMARVEQLNSAPVRLHTLYPSTRKAYRACPFVPFCAELHSFTCYFSCYCLVHGQLGQREDERIYLIIRLGALLLWQTASGTWTTLHSFPWWAD